MDEIRFREALDWAIAEIEGRTRYKGEEQRENALNCAKEALAAFEELTQPVVAAKRPHLLRAKLNLMEKRKAAMIEHFAQSHGVPAEELRAFVAFMNGWQRNIEFGERMLSAREAMQEAPRV